MECKRDESTCVFNSLNELMNQKRKGYSVLQKQKVISSDICAAFKGKFHKGIKQTE